ncbi:MULTISPECIES: anthranilate synthase component I [Cylindrospermopsis]|jgi:anthranilate synthase component 1|uniref:anthranilate synthase component I n=1 Tax=Cylindrospermopsis TaxID=77021 RepID=UPI00070D7CA3|nr:MULTISPECIES: anthranilate synthase component I [Cylindrospermopsis]MBU6345347.1 anthranilate synthase component I [Cyanobacteria bacterium REEB494]KRH97803.1 anthranilate synthase [Cylindrospermopsis sp. CR12]TPX28151.1 anthranilate synthase component I [Cylindrospermopsis raciborskii GIHE 2018]UJL34545.1 anthranilate synthase component I [Cylindrospermopsis raciborskii Cr2010]UJS04069.1 anthranilate synthase component I [Cylindrospermopsis raciborskii KLL07]
MIFPDFQQFIELAQQGNFVPVYQEWVADLDTPVSAWYKVCAGQPYSFLLESVEGGEKVGRYSLLGCDPLWILEARGNQTTQIYRDGRRQVFQGDPFRVLADCLAPYHPVKLPELPSGIGGLFGFWGYELINWIEPTVPIHSQDDRYIPDGLWMQVDHLLIFDQVKRKIWAIAYADVREGVEESYQKACNCIKQMVEKLSLPLTKENTQLTWKSPQNRPKVDIKEYSSNFTREQFCASVEKAKEHIRAGDIFQVVISQRLGTEYRGNPFELYRSLRQINPSPYMAFFNFDDWQIIGSSPEVMVKADRDDEEGGIIATVRPLAGTRPRGKTTKEDGELAADLLADPKEVAEHIMLVDLGRNDLGRVCQNGTVKVDELMIVERYSHVMHIVSNVVGKLAEDKTAWDLLKACFPAGTVSGAPKIRAMQIINQLEPTRRGVYSGVYGYYDFEGQLNTAISIRTMVLKDGTVSVQAGAGLVADSQPEKEYEETLNKARGLLEAIRCLKEIT